MTKLKEIARAMWEQRRKKAKADGIDLEAWGDGFWPNANGIMDEARAAVEAMREPSIEMRMAIPPQSYTIEHYDGSGHHRTFPTLGSGPIPAWQAMIDSILSEAEKERG